MYDSTAILFVDDEEIIRQSVKMILEKFTSYLLEFAANAEEALAKIAATPYDLIIVDFNMPGMKGDSLISEIRKTDISIPIIMLTGHAGLKEASSLLETYNISDFIQKSFLRPEPLVFSIKEEPKGDARPFSKESKAHATLDIEDALQIMNGNETILYRCFEMFIDILPPTFEIIERAIYATDESGLNQSIHKFKGTLKNIAAKRAVYIAGQIEIAGKEGDMILAGEHLHALIHECENIKASIIQQKNKTLPN